ncbi:MAG: hypothetical protein KGD65_13495 [Candidatus Lokiarchaeota archaeon]|nr:hypothetical protein [Candidatus Lokiarchaeota archaeon]
MAPNFPPDPSISETVVPNCVKADKDGIINISIAEAKSGKLEEALTRTQQNAVQYHNIVGFEYSIEVWSTAVEAFAAIGRTPPEYESEKYC